MTCGTALLGAASRLAPAGVACAGDLEPGGDLSGGASLSPGMSAAAWIVGVGALSVGGDLCGGASLATTGALGRKTMVGAGHPGAFLTGTPHGVFDTPPWLATRGGTFANGPPPAASRAFCFATAAARLGGLALASSAAGMAAAATGAPAVVGTGALALGTCTGYGGWPRDCGSRCIHFLRYSHLN